MNTSDLTLPEQLLQAALKAPDKDLLRPHLGPICVLRDKGYSWREISEFLAEKGIQADHTKIFRLFTKHRSEAMNIPDAAAYLRGLQAIKLSSEQKAMLAFHYGAHNRTVTYTQLAHSVNKSADYRLANSVYGTLGRTLGEAIGYSFPIANARGAPFYSASLGIDAPRSVRNEYRMMMHHELAKAIEMSDLISAVN